MGDESTVVVSRLGSKAFWVSTCIAGDTTVADGCTGSGWVGGKYCAGVAAFAGIPCEELAVEDNQAA